MADRTKISWVDRTWSPWFGCQKVGPACDHCYAEGWAKRSGIVGWGPGEPRRLASPAYWKRPEKWNAEAAAAGIRDSVFPSLCDPFDNAVDPVWRLAFFDLIRATPHLDWLLLTKRAGNVVEMVEAAGGWPDNAILGGTIILQGELDRDMPKLAEAKRRLGIRVLFLSMEPLLGPCDVSPWAGVIDRIVAGGESGPHARVSHPDWFRQIRDACAFYGIGFEFKQWGEWVSVYDRDAEDPDWRRCAEFGRLESAAGRWMNLAGGNGFHGDRVQFMRRIGTKAAGNTLDGRTHSWADQ